MVNLLGPFDKDSLTRTVEERLNQFSQNQWVDHGQQYHFALMGGETRWWQYREAGSHDGSIEIRDAGKQDASLTVRGDAGNGKTIHIICEVTDTGTPQLTRYQRVVVEIE